MVGTVDHERVLEQIGSDSGWSSHYAFMTAMSAGIAVLGLLLSSPAVVIGAMLISPLMGPIIGLGFALATFDSAWMRRCLAALGGGIALAIGFSVIIVWLSPLHTVTDEIAARTRPNLFDLLVALFSGLAGSYAMIRGRHGTIVGVAVATALMPPLAVVAFGLATANSTVFAGSFLLFFTNLMTIAASAAVLARLYGFAQDLSPRQTRLQVVLVTGVLIALAVPLALSLRQIAWEAVASRKARETISADFGSDARVSAIDIDFHSRPIAISATVLTPRYDRAAEARLKARLAAALEAPVQIAVDQLRIGSGESEAVELASAKAGQNERATAREPDRIAARLALVAGVDPSQVLVDPSRRRALVRAGDLPGADLSTYRALEKRVAEVTPGWTVLLVPPASPLPDIEFDGEAPSVAGSDALATAVWAARRIRLPLAASARRAADRDKVIEALVRAGVDARAGDGKTATSGVQLTWLVPAASQAKAVRGTR